MKNAANQTQIPDVYPERESEGDDVAAPMYDTAADADNIVVAGRGGKSVKWHCFKFIWKNTGAHGHIEATCPFHRGTFSAPACRKTLAIPSAEGLESTMLTLMAWCVIGPDHSRKHLHLGAAALAAAYAFAGAPGSRAVIEAAAAGMEAPEPGSILPDHIMDDLVDDGAGSSGSSD